MSSLFEQKIQENKRIKEIPVEQKALIYTCVCNVNEHNKAIRNDLMNYMNRTPDILRKILIEKKKLLHDKTNTQAIYDHSVELDDIYEKIYARNSHLASVVYNFMIYDVSNEEFIESLKNKEVMDTILKYEEEDQKFYGNVPENVFSMILDQARRFCVLLINNKGFDPESKTFVYNNEMFDDFGFIKNANNPSKLDDPAFLVYPYTDFGGFDNKKYNTGEYIEKTGIAKPLNNIEVKELKNAKIWVNPGVPHEGSTSWDGCPGYRGCEFGEIMRTVNEYWDTVFGQDEE